jgi:hypothetical protein
MRVTRPAIRRSGVGAPGLRHLGDWYPCVTDVTRDRGDENFRITRESDDTTVQPTVACPRAVALLRGVFADVVHVVSAGEGLVGAARSAAPGPPGGE